VTISSNTLVKNGMPFIGKVLRQVAPYMKEIVICISERSSDGTEVEIRKELKDYWHKVVWMTENVTDKMGLTECQNEMTRRSTSDWILFLSDDDYWPQDQLERCLEELDKKPDVLCYAVNPYQLIDHEHHDHTWRKKFFTKFLRNTSNLHYVGKWPDELPADDDGKKLYWKWHDKVIVLPYRYYHLSYLKDSSFRNEPWANAYSHEIGRAIRLSEPFVP